MGHKLLSGGERRRRGTHFNCFRSCPAHAAPGGSAHRQRIRRRLSADRANKFSSERENSMLNPADALRLVEAERNNAVVVTTMMGSRMWKRVSRNPELDLHVGGAMGKASSVGLGLALAQPELKVIILDGDGSILMNLGSLVTIANKAPAKLYHLVLENGMYAMTGGQPVPGVGRFNLAGIAKEAGY